MTEAQIWGYYMGLLGGVSASIYIYLPSETVLNLYWLRAQQCVGIPNWSPKTKQNVTGILKVLNRKDYSNMPKFIISTNTPRPEYKT